MDVGDLQAKLDAMKPTRWAPEPTYPCKKCLVGRGWIALRNGTVRPCEECRPRQYARWKGGHYNPGHACRECEKLRYTKTQHKDSG